MVIALSFLISCRTAALNNNTAALNAVKNDRGATRALVDYHEKVSKDRIDAVMGEINETVQSNAKGIRIVRSRGGDVRWSIHMRSTSRNMTPVSELVNNAGLKDGYSLITLNKL